MKIDLGKTPNVRSFRCTSSDVSPQHRIFQVSKQSPKCCTHAPPDPHPAKPSPRLKNRHLSWTRDLRTVPSLSVLVHLGFGRNVFRISRVPVRQRDTADASPLLFHPFRALEIFRSDQHDVGLRHRARRWKFFGTVCTSIIDVSGGRELDFPGPKTQYGRCFCPGVNCRRVTLFDIQMKRFAVQINRCYRRRFCELAARSFRFGARLDSGNSRRSITPEAEVLIFAQFDATLLRNEVLKSTV